MADGREVLREEGRGGEGGEGRERVREIFEGGEIGEILELGEKGEILEVGEGGDRGLQEVGGETWWTGGALRLGTNTSVKVTLARLCRERLGLRAELGVGVVGVFQVPL